MNAPKPMVNISSASVPRFVLLFVALACVAAEDDGCATTRDVNNVRLKDSGVDAETPDDADASTQMPDDVSGDAAPADWWDAEYHKRVRIEGTYDRQISATNIPIVLRLSEHVTLDAEPRELRFVDEEGIVYEHEVVEWGDEKTVWVLIPELGPRSVFWMYWANPDALDRSDPQAVWEDGFEFVGHLESELPKDVVDPTRVGESSGQPKWSEGVVGMGYDFGGADALSFGNRGETDGVPAETQYTWEVWLNARSARDSIIFANEGFCSGVSLDMAPDGGSDVYFSSGGTGEPQDWCDSGYSRAHVEGPPLALGEWHYLVAWIDRVNQTLEVQVDAEPVGDTALQEEPNGEGYYLTIGGNRVGAKGFDGVIDEPRISSVRRSEDWVTFQNLATRDQLFDYSAVETF